jgi:hypothetical protein
MTVAGSHGRVPPAARSGEWAPDRYVAPRCRPSAGRRAEVPGVDRDPWLGDNQQVFTAVAAFAAGLGRPYGVAAGN